MLSIMKIIGLSATPLYAPRWLPYVDENGTAYSGSEGRAGVDGRPPDQNKRRRTYTDESRGGVVVIHTDSEHMGLGEVSTCWSPDAVEQCACVVEVLAPVVIGVENPAAQINKVVIAMDKLAGMEWSPAKAAVEMALMDLAGKQLGVPVCTLLGGAVRDRIALSHSIGQAEPAQMAELARRKVAEGFCTVKLKVGESLTHDIERCAAVRAAIGPAVTMRVDANGAWATVAEALETIIAIQTACDGYVRNCATTFWLHQPHFSICLVLRAVLRCRIQCDRQLEIVEQPMPRACLQEMAELRQALQGRALIMADESCWEPLECAELIKERSVDVVSVYVHESGRYTQPSGIPASRCHCYAVAESH